MLDLAGEAETFFQECIEKRQQINIGKLWKNAWEKLKKEYPYNSELGKRLLYQYLPLE